MKLRKKNRRPQGHTCSLLGRSYYAKCPTRIAIHFSKINNSHEKQRKSLETHREHIGQLLPFVGHVYIEFIDWLPNLVYVILFPGLCLCQFFARFGDVSSTDFERVWDFFMVHFEVILHIVLQIRQN